VSQKFLGTFAVVALHTKDYMKKLVFFLVGIVLLWASSSLHAQTAPLTNTVVGTFDFSAFSVNGQPNLPLTLQRGVTYVFQVDESSAPFHPFYIKTTFTIGAVDLYNSGVTGNGTTGGNLIFSVPMDAPDVLYYHCGNHQPMGAMLTIVNPPASAPDGRIVLITLSDTGVTMQSLGVSNWTAIPEFSSNLTLNAWATVPNYTNSFANGTNTTTFNRLDPICGPNVFLRIRNQSQ
jgi:hypothetical protein